MKKKFLLLGMSFGVFILLFGCNLDMRNNSVSGTESASIIDAISEKDSKRLPEEADELSILEIQDDLIALPELEVLEREDEFLIPLADEVINSVESVSCAIVGWDEDGYYPILYGREVSFDENHTVHIPKEQSVVTLFFADTDQTLPLTRFYESQNKDGFRTWYSKNFSLSGAGDIGEFYHVDLNLSETEKANSGNEFLNYTFTPTSNEIYNPVMEKVAYEYWNYVYSSKRYRSEIYDANGKIIPATEWAGPGLYKKYFPYSGYIDELKFQLTSLHEIPGTYYCQLILNLKDGRVAASELMLLQQNEGDCFNIITYPYFAEIVEMKTEQGVLYFEVYDDYAVLCKYFGEDSSLDIPDKVNDVFVTEIGREAFANNLTLQEIKFPSELTRIDELAFYNTNLAEIHLPDKLEYIGYEAFGVESFSIMTNEFAEEYTNKDIEEVRIGKNVLWIGGGAFSSYCIRNFEVDPENPYYMSEDGVIYSKDQTCLIACPTGKNGVFQIPDGVVKVSPDAFQNNGFYSEVILDSYGIVSIILPDSVQIFACDQFPMYLESLSVGKELKEWRYQILCQILSKLTISEDNQNYQEENGIIYNGDKSELVYYLLNEEEDIVYLPEGLQVILDNAFNIGYNSVVTEVHIPEGVHTIGNSNFSYISKLDLWDVVHVYLPDSLTEIKEYAFYESPGIVIHASENSYGALFAEKHEIQLEVK